VGNIYSVARRIRYLRERDTQVANLFEAGVSVDLLAHIGADAADVAHFVKDSTQLRREEQ
jgi:hypothetical protein